MIKEKLGNIAEFINGRAFKPSDWSESGIPIIRIQNLNDHNKQFNFFKGQYDEKYFVRKGDVLLSWSGTPGTSFGCFLWERSSDVLNQHIFNVKIDETKCDKRYFIRAVNKNLNLLINQVHGGVGLQHITKAKLVEIKIPLPPLPVQQKIAAILDAADALKQKDKALIAKYTELTQSLFLDMFGDPKNNQNNFEKGSIRDLVSEVKYGTSSKAIEGGTYPYLRMNNITYNGYIDFKDLKYIDLGEKKKKKYLVKKGDVLFNRTNSKELVGKTAIYTEIQEMATAGYLIRVRANNKANPYFIWGYLNSKHGKLILNNMCKNIVGMANINAQELQDIKILIPPISLQNEFAERVEAIEAQKQQVEASLQKSEELFNSLLQRAFKGELVS